MKTRFKIWHLLLVVLVIYIGLGLVFHLGWEAAQAECRHVQASRGAFVEPPAFAWRSAWHLT